MTISRGGARALGGGTSESMRPTFATQSMNVKQTDAPVWADDSEAVRKVMEAAAGDILVSYNGSCPLDRGFLYEVKRTDSRRDFDNTARLVYHARQSGNIHAVSDAIRAYELATAPERSAECLVEAGLALERADVAVDEARVMYAKEPTPTRAAVLWECLKELYHRAGRCADLAASKMARRAV